MYLNHTPAMLSCMYVKLKQSVAMTTESHKLAMLILHSCILYTDLFWGFRDVYKTSKISPQNSV